MSLSWPILQGAKSTVLNEETKKWFEFRNSWFLQPIFTDDSDYPQVMKNKIAENSRIQGFTESRLPEFTFNDILMIKHSADFLGVNFYSAATIRNYVEYNVSTTISFEGDMGLIEIIEQKNSTEFRDKVNIIFYKLFCLIYQI